MPKQKNIVTEGTVDEVLPNALFRVRLNEESEQTILCHLSGRMRQANIRVMIGDAVKLEMSPYDLTKGRIVYRFK